MLRLLFTTFAFRFVIAGARIRAYSVFSAEQLLRGFRCLRRLLLSVKSLVMLSELCPALLA